MLASTEFDGDYLYFNKLPLSGEQVRLGTWPTIVFERSTSGTDWEEEELDFNIPLLNFHTERFPAVQAWSQTIPDNIQTLAKAYQSSQVPALHLLAHPASVDLATAHPILFWLLCESLDSQMYFGKAMALLKAKRRDILGEVLGTGRVPEAVVKFARKIKADSSTCTRDNREAIMGCLRNLEAVKALAHYQTIPLTWIGLAARQPEMFGVPVIRRIASNAEPADVAEAIGLIRDIRRMRDFMDPRNVARMDGYQQAVDLVHLQEIHDRYVELQNHHEALSLGDQVEELKNIYGTEFPKCPLDGTPNIQEIRTPEEMIEEGRVMNHCVGSYSLQVYKGQCFIFKVVSPERATAELRLQGSRLMLKQLKCANNHLASAATYEAVQNWLGTQSTEKEGLEDTGPQI
jgi:hypothetical protein